MGQLEGLKTSQRVGGPLRLMPQTDEEIFETTYNAFDGFPCDRVLCMALTLALQAAQDMRLSREDFLRFVGDGWDHRKSNAQVN